MDWQSQVVGGTIEVEITFKCNLKCRHCNRFCNSEEKYNLIRTNYEMNMEHINYLCSEIMRVLNVKASWMWCAKRCSKTSAAST